MQSKHPVYHCDITLAQVQVLSCVCYCMCSGSCASVVCAVMYIVLCDVCVVLHVLLSVYCTEYSVLRAQYCVFFVACVVLHVL